MVIELLNLLLKFCLMHLLLLIFFPEMMIQAVILFIFYPEMIIQVLDYLLHITVVMVSYIFDNGI